MRPPGATPFTRHAWLSALERSGCASAASGFTPAHLTLWEGSTLVAAAPAYVKDDSDGDFSRDFGFADAALRANRPYYPKLAITVPFTPCTGERLLVAPGVDRRSAIDALLHGARHAAEVHGWGTLQVLFPTAAEQAELEVAGLAGRTSIQYHFQNQGWSGWDEFLQSLTAKRRHMLKRERLLALSHGLTIRTVRGEALARESERWGAAAHALHTSTVDKLVWGRRWLNRGFYDAIFATMPDALELVVAQRGDTLVAGAFNATSSTRLFGRYWGCFEELPYLHFHVCLYHSMEDVLARGLQAFEGGAGGEHKLPRGFQPARTHSAHLFLDPAVDRALRRYLEEETAARADALSQHAATERTFKRRAP